VERDDAWALIGGAAITLERGEILVEEWEDGVASRARRMKECLRVVGAV
jgi:hypothetical protein